MLKKLTILTLITCGLWLCMGRQAVTHNELAVWKSSGELVKNRDARAHGLKFWFSTSENLFKNEKQSFPGGLNTEARFEPTGELSFFSRWLEWSLVAMETTDLPLSQSEFYFFFFQVHICFKNRGPYFMERRVFSLRHFERKSKAPKRQKNF